MQQVKKKSDDVDPNRKIIIIIISAQFSSYANDRTFAELFAASKVSLTTSASSTEKRTIEGKAKHEDDAKMGAIINCLVAAPTEEWNDVRREKSQQNISSFILVLRCLKLFPSWEIYAMWLTEGGEGDNLIDRDGC